MYIVLGMDGEANWWTTSGKIRIPPLAMVMGVGRQQQQLLAFVFYYVYVDLRYDEIYLTFTAEYVCWCGVCSHVVVLGLSVTRLGTLCCGCVDCDACTIVCV